MDIDFTRTFLEIARQGGFSAAAERLHLTQTAVTARIQKLESYLNCKLFERHRTGARLTPDGEAFLIFANQMMQTWDNAQSSLPRLGGARQILRIGGETSLCNPLVVRWVARLRECMSSFTVNAKIDSHDILLDQLERGELDVALVYRPHYWSGVQVEQLLEEKLILVTTNKPAPYVYIHWGQEFKEEHDKVFPEHRQPDVSFNLGPIALQYILENGGSAYFRTRVVQSYLEHGVLSRVPQAPEFTYPTYLVYSLERNNAALQQALDVLRVLVKEDPDWSQRWDPLGPQKSRYELIKGKRQGSESVFAGDALALRA